MRPQAKTPRKTREITPDMQIIEVSATEFGWNFDACPRCWWDKRHGVSPVPESFATVLRKSASAMERAVSVDALREIGIPAVREIKVPSVRSAPVFWHEIGKGGFIAGRPDRVFECEDETLAVIECKCSDLKESRVTEAIRQVEAYAYCLHYPDVGPSRRVSAAGVLIWTPSDMVFDAKARLGHLTGSYSFHRATCSRETAESRLKSAISNLTGARPRPGYYCSVCQAVEARAKRA